MPSTVVAINKNNPRDLQLVTAGQGVSMVGTAISDLAIPIMAVDLLGANSFGTGILGAATTVGYLAIGLQAGVWIDRLPRRQFLLAADVVRALLLLAIPALFVANLLTLPLLIAIQLGIGTASIFFNLAWPAYLPRLATGDILLKLNARLALLGEISGFLGPGIAGALIGLVKAPFALVADAFTFVVSYLSLAAIKTPEPPRATHSGLTVTQELRDGLRAVWQRPTLRLITLEAVNGNVAFSIMIGQSVIYQRLDLGFEPALIGAIASIGFLGGAIGSILAPRAVKRIGFGRLLFWDAVLFGLIELLLPLAGIAPRAFAFPLVAINYFFGGFLLLLYVVPATAFRQQVVPDRLLGRVMAVNRVATWGFGATLGFVIGGIIAEATSRPTALFVSAILQTAVPLVMFGFGSFRSLRTIEEAVALDNRKHAR
ncbi:MAG: MFS transporter [Candidatus Limnocylindrus sp.]